jgi:hypothetical protein
MSSSTTRVLQAGLRSARGPSLALRVAGWLCALKGHGTRAPRPVLASKKQSSVSHGSDPDGMDAQWIAINHRMY